MQMPKFINRFTHWYHNALVRRPLATKTVTLGTLAVLGDAYCQMLEDSKCRFKFGPTFWLTISSNPGQVSNLLSLL